MTRDGGRGRRSTEGEAKRKHDIDSTECWCGPELLQPCPECPVEPGHVEPNPDCWRCGGRGLVPHYDDMQPSVIVHGDDA